MFEVRLKEFVTFTFRAKFIFTDCRICVTGNDKNSLFHNRPLWSKRTDTHAMNGQIVLLRFL